MFAPNDVDYSKSILSDCYEKELNYTDFLSGKVTTGFIHCISTDIMKRYPFDESVRIHEGVFFLSFYKEAQRMFFSNRIVTIRERGRSDSVTLLYDNYLLLGRYKCVAKLTEEYKKEYITCIPTTFKQRLLNVLYLFRLGLFYRLLLQLYLLIKYTMFKVKIK